MDSLEEQIEIDPEDFDSYQDSEKTQLWSQVVIMHYWCTQTYLI